MRPCKRIKTQKRPPTRSQRRHRSLPADVKPFCGFGRSHVYNLIDTGAIRSVCLRQKGKSKGVRLISVESLRSYIASQCEGVAK